MEAGPLIIAVFNHWPAARQRHLFEVWPGINPNRYRLEVPASFQIRLENGKPYLYVVADLANSNERDNDDVIQWVRSAAEQQFAEWVQFHRDLFHSLRVVMAAYPQQLSEFLDLPQAERATDAKPGENALSDEH